MPPVATRAKQFAAWQEKPVKDYDPEADAPDQDGSGIEGEDEDDLAATEHYLSVGKSKLRQNQAPSLGPKYRGVRISRAALDDGSSSDGEPEEEEDDDEDGEGQDAGDSEVYDDPETADLELDNVIDDEEIDSDEAFEDGDEELFKGKGFSFRGSSKPVTSGRRKRPVAADWIPSSEDEGREDDNMNEYLDESGSEEQEADKGEGAKVSDDEDDEDAESSEAEDEDEDMDSSASDTDEDEGEDEDDDASPRLGHNSLTAALRKAPGRAKDVANNSISQAAKADAEKGVAVRQQRRTFDSFLKLRIRLQKGLIAVNSLGVAEDKGQVDKEPYEAAEAAAIKLWNAIDNLRASLLPASTPQAGQKRKRDFDAETPSEQVWDAMKETEERAAHKREKILDKWDRKVKSGTATVSTRQLVSSTTQPLVSALQDQLLGSERLVRRTRIPRSCAPVQAAGKVSEDADIYDDADFYQLLLKELVDQRTTDGATPGGNVPTVRWAALKEAKTRKQVDRKASKGRKLRFTVHEKLQNFMAPEDRRSWEEDAIDRLFGTLFGQKMQLKEDEDGSSDDDDMGGGVGVGEQAVRLFAS